MRKSSILTNRNPTLNVRPRATKHLYRPASAEHVVRHLGSPISRVKPYFVFAGREFFQQTTNYSPLYQRTLSSAVSLMVKIRNFIFFKNYQLEWITSFTSVEFL